MTSKSLRSSWMRGVWPLAAFVKGKSDKLKMSMAIVIEAFGTPADNSFSFVAAPARLKKTARALFEGLTRSRAILGFEIPSLESSLQNPYPLGNIVYYDTTGTDVA